DGRLCRVRIRQPRPLGVLPRDTCTVVGARRTAARGAPTRRFVAEARTAPAGHLHPRPVGELVSPLAAPGLPSADPRLARRPQDQRDPLSHRPAATQPPPLDASSTRW